MTEEQVTGYVIAHGCVSGLIIVAATIATALMTGSPLLVLGVLGLFTFACYRHLKYKLIGFGYK